MKSVVFIILIFLIIQILGLYIGNGYVGYINQAIESGEIEKRPEIIEGVSPERPENSLILFGFIIITTICILLIIKYKKSFLRGIEAIAIYFPSLIAFLFLIPFGIQSAWEKFIANIIFPLSGFFSYFGFIGIMSFNILFLALTLSSLFAIVLTVWKILKPSITSQNIAAIFSGAGAGAAIGATLGISPSIIFIMILSVYDVISVFVTKHMVEMAKAITERPMAFTIAAPHEFKKAKFIPQKGAKKKVHIFQLGLGDVIIPLMFSVSILNKFTIFHSVITMVGSMIGLLFLIFYITRKPQALPALPFVCTGALAGYLVSLFVL